MIASGRGLVVSSERLRLRGLAERDLALTLAWRNDGGSVRWFKSKEPLQWDTHAAWFARYVASDSPDCMYFAETLGGQPIGQLSVYNFDRESATAEVGRFISAPETRGTGMFRDALILMLLVAFEVIGLESVHLEVMEENERAIRLYRSVGFTEISRIDGLILMSLVREALLCSHMQYVIAPQDQEKDMQ